MINILITGASRGIGKFLINQFWFKRGYDVHGTYNNTPVSETSKNYLSKVDITNENQVKQWVLDSVGDSEKIVLINCAGINYNSFAHKADLEMWESVITTNLVGTFKVIKSVLPYMRNREYGRIINISSVVPQIGVMGTSAYSASKSALWGMTRAISIENFNKGITINTINLGYFEIGMISEIPPESSDVIKNKIPMKHFGNPNEILKAIQYLIESDYITGTSIDINGGLF
jgi:acetoacetyl-CoA reductase/3-oxoacyl-[acyl-carrier protein] reductase